MTNYVVIAENTIICLSMDVVARISKEWRRRMLFMFFMIFGIAGWFMYDGYLLWPDEAQRYSEYAKIKDALAEAGEAVDEESTALRIAWERHAREQDYRRNIPKERTDGDIHEQRVIGWVMMVGALLYGLWIAWNHTRTVRAEGETIIGASGERVELDAITAIDRKKWKNKGIAYGIYEDGGKKRRLTLDEHKFKGCEAIILEAEKRIHARAEPAG
jgi:hypothetical protein